MIKIGNRDITLKLGSTNVSAAYLGSVQVYGGSPSYDLCYGVTDDISTYTGTFKDVFDKSSDTWYKRNNLNEYEEYGIYGSGRSITTYDGKLTIDDGYEYQYTNGAWVNVGEVSGGTTPLPDVPFTVNINAKQYDSTTKTFAKTQGQLANTDITITQGNVTPHDDYVTVTGSTRGVISGYQQYFNRTNLTPNLTIISKQKTNGDYGHMFANRSATGNYNWMYRVYSTHMTLHGNSEQGRINVTTQPVIESVRIDSNSLATYNNYTNNTSSTQSSFSYGNTNSGGFALFAGYTDSGGEWFSGDFYWVYMSQNTLTDAQVQQVIDYNEGGGSSEYPIYYDEKADPLDNLTFNTLAEAEAYAYANCVYDGMKATIAGGKYVFDSENGWTLVPEYYIVTDITPQGASGWTITGSSTYNPDSSYYDDFSVENTTTSYVTKIAKVTIYGYENFTYYLRSYGYASYAVAYATNVDELASDPTTNFGYTSSSAITNTYKWNINAGSNVDLGHYRRVTFNNLDKTVEHTFYIVFNGRTYSSYQANATILIPKEQTNENWEQVTFSASSNVASTKKNLYIDNNTSTSGGMETFYYRYVVGLPSGTHTSNTNYSDYNYCPNVTSSTFTSVAGEQRQVNFTYNDTTNKWLDYYLVDTSGNTLSHSDIVYYNMTYYNPCNASKSQILNIINSSVRDLVKDGGSFVFGNSSNRHYIYGYQPPTLGTRYYVDNYQSTFDIVYTKLSEEAVTLSYVTYDPNDTETPSFNTEITYPYGGGTISATTLTSFNVPYSYTYIPKTGNELFSVDSQTYTAGQASRTITLTLYPNNREFSTVADMEAYQYAWEGMIGYVGSARYKYENGEWTQTIWIKASETILSVSGATTLQITEWVANMKYPRKIKMNKNTSGSGSYCWAYFKKLNTDPDPFLSIPSSTENYINYNGRQYSPPTILSWITEEDGYWIFDLEESGDYGYLFLNKYQTNFLLNNLEFMF